MKFIFLFVCVCVCVYFLKKIIIWQDSQLVFSKSILSCRDSYVCIYLEQFKYTLNWCGSSVVKQLTFTVLFLNGLKSNTIQECSQPILDNYIEVQLFFIPKNPARVESDAPFKLNSSSNFLHNAPYIFCFLDITLSPDTNTMQHVSSIQHTTLRAKIRKSTIQINKLKFY